jgi:CDP-diacylglycerol--glycerol-3-phosphate 3-phosphatidyltransferase
MFPVRFQHFARAVAEGIVGPLASHGVTPNMVTLVGFFLNIGTAAVLATGHLSAGGALLFLSGLFDMLDGALARVTKQQSDFGAFLDSLLDRYSEAVILLALIFVFSMRNNTPAVVLVYAVAGGSLLISYARARAQSLGVNSKVGIAPRPERVLILGIGLLFNPWTTIAALSVLAFLTHITVLQRLYDVWRQMHRKDPDVPRRATTQTQKHKQEQTIG